MTRTRTETIARIRRRWMKPPSASDRGLARVVGGLAHGLPIDGRLFDGWLHYRVSYGRLSACRLGRRAPLAGTALLQCDRNLDKTEADAAFPERACHGYGSLLEEKDPSPLPSRGRASARERRYVAEALRESEVRGSPYRKLREYLTRNFSLFFTAGPGPDPRSGADLDGASTPLPAIGDAPQNWEPRPRRGISWHGTC